MILGIIGTVLLVLALILVIVLIIAIAVVAASTDDRQLDLAPSRQSRQPTSTGSLTRVIPKRSSTPARISRARSSSSAVVALPTVGDRERVS